jgi:hypothetical protein
MSYTPSVQSLDAKSHILLANSNSNLMPNVIFCSPTKTVKSHKIDKTKRNSGFLWWTKMFSVLAKIHREMTFVEVVAKSQNQHSIFFWNLQFWSIDFFSMTSTNVISQWNFVSTEKIGQCLHQKRIWIFNQYFGFYSSPKLIWARAQKHHVQCVFLKQLGGKNAGAICFSCSLILHCRRQWRRDSPAPQPPSDPYLLCWWRNASPVRHSRNKQLVATTTTSAKNPQDPRPASSVKYEVLPPYQNISRFCSLNI